MNLFHIFEFSEYVCDVANLVKLAVAGTRTTSNIRRECGKDQNEEQNYNLAFELHILRKFLKVIKNLHQSTNFGPSKLQELLKLIILFVISQVYNPVIKSVRYIYKACF